LLEPGDFVPDYAEGGPEENNMLASEESGKIKSINDSEGNDQELISKKVKAKKKI